MSWEQHRYAVERARDRMKATADRINDHCMECSAKHDGSDDWRCGCPDGEPTFAGATLQGEAASSDAEMLDDVADFLRSLEGSKKGQAITDPGGAFVADWNQMIAVISNVCGQYDLPKPDMVFLPVWQARMSMIAQTKIGSPLIYAGVRCRFGRFASFDALVPA